MSPPTPQPLPAPSPARAPDRVPRVGVFGAGAIGTFVGTLLSAAGVPVTLLGRRWLVEQREAIEAVGRRGRSARLAPHAVVTDDPAALAAVDVCLVCVKSAGTEQAAATLREVLSPRALVLSLQNGLRNRSVLAERLEQPVGAGVVGFNVRPDAEGRYPQTSPGPLWLEAGDDRTERLARALARVGQPTRLHPRIGEVMRGKLLLNTINGVGGATGLPIRALLSDADARWCYSRCIREGLAVFAARGEPVARVSGPGPRWLSLLLRLPDLVMRPLVALSSLDPRADTSTAQDLRRGRTTEIDQLNGALVVLGARHDVPTPVNHTIVRTVREHEANVRAGVAPHFWSAASLRARCTLLPEGSRPRGAGLPRAAHAAHVDP